MNEKERQTGPGAESSGPTVKARSTQAEQWVLTFGENGEIAKIEKIDPQSSDRQELSEEEYAAVAGVDLSGASDYWNYYGAGGDPSGYEDVYYQGVSDALEASYGSSGMTPEEAAYYQGMEDFMNYCT